MIGAGDYFAADLFGEPLGPPMERRGRPRHVPTADLRQRVAQLHAEGLGQVKIAHAIGITGPTLARHYRLELNSKSQAWRGLIVRERGGN